jgi:hypothetical protein
VLPEAPTYPENLGIHESAFLGRSCNPPWILAKSKGSKSSLRAHLGGAMGTVIHRVVLVEFEDEPQETEQTDA